MVRLIGTVVVALFAIGLVTAHGGNLVATGQSVASTVSGGLNTVQGWWAHWQASRPSVRL